MYCTRQVIQGENFHDWLKNHENRESFPPQKFCRIWYTLHGINHSCHNNWKDDGAFGFFYATPAFSITDWRGLVTKWILTKVR